MNEKKCNHIVGIYYEKESDEARKIFKSDYKIDWKKLVEKDENIFEKFKYCPHCGKKLDWQSIKNS